MKFSTFSTFKKNSFRGNYTRKYGNQKNGHLFQTHNKEDPTHVWTGMIFCEGWIAKATRIEKTTGMPSVVGLIMRFKKQKNITRSYQNSVSFHCMEQTGTWDAYSHQLGSTPISKLRNSYIKIRTNFQPCNPKWKSLW